jgi:hypothetical protein
MRFRLHGGNLHVHGCAQHPKGCDFFDHAPTWMVGNRDSARAQLLIYRRSVVARITSLTAVLASIDLMLTRLNEITLAKTA